MSGYGTPYRPPCGGWPEPRTWYLGGLHQHHNQDHAAIRVLKNTTQVPNPACIEACSPPTPCEPAQVPPYTRPSSEYCNDQFGDPGQEADLACCLAKSGPITPEPENTYVESDPPEYIDRSVCRKIGFKNVYANKLWHGVFGPTSHQHARRAVGMRGDCGCMGHFEPALTPDLTKYRTITATATYTRDDWLWVYTGGCPTGRINETSVTGSMTSTSSVARDSGIETGSCTSTTANTAILSTLSELFGWTFTTYEQLREAYCATVAFYSGWTGVTFSGTSMTITDSYDQEIVTLVLDESAGTLVYHTRGRYQCGTGEPYTVYYEDIDHLSIAITAESVNYTRTHYENLTEGGSYSEYSLIAAFLDPYTSAMLNLDTDTLIETYKSAILDDAVYPWRADGAWNRGPLVTRNETAGAPTIHTTPGTYTSGAVPRPERAPGAIIGLPNPAGYEPYFDFFHPTWEGFAATDDSGEQWRIKEYGGYCPSEYPCATQWLSNRQAQFIPAGPFASYFAFRNPTTYSTQGCPIQEFPGLLKCAWFETIMYAVPSHDFSRPCGEDDRAAVNWTGNCASTPTIRWPDIPCHCDDPTITADCSNVPVPPETKNQWHDNGRKGDYLYKSFSFDFRDWREAYNDRAAAWGMTQREECSASVWEPMDAIRYIENPAYWEGFWFGSDYILGGDTIQSGSLWLKTMTTTQACLPYSHCSPSVAYCAPSTYDFPGASTNHEWPALNCDEGYGSLWMGRIQQWIPDPLWQAPGTPEEITRLCADETCGTLMSDDGSCLPDGYVRPDGTTGLVWICYYPLTPFVEARNSVPTGAPALPAGAANYFCGDIVGQLNSNPPVSSHISCYPLYGFDLMYKRDTCGGYVLYGGPSGYVPPWITFLRMEICVRSGGRFAAQYRKNGINPPLDP